MYHSFENLEVWKKAYRLVIQIYSALSGTKEYFIKDQILRSSLSIPSNIAEGAERNSKQEFIRFLHIAKGSCGELRTQLMIARDLKIINDAEEFINQTTEISSMLHGLIKKIEASQNKTSKQ